MKFTHNKDYANFLPRFLAHWIDHLLFSLHIPVLFFFILSTSRNMSPVVDISKDGLIAGLVATAVWFLVFVMIPMGFVSLLHKVIGLSKFGKTIGKAILGIEVTDREGKHITWQMAVFREFIAKVVSVSLVGAGFWNVLVDPKHQAWHDYFVGTLVHKRSNRTLVGLVIVIGLLAVHVYFYVQAIHLIQNYWLSVFWV